MNIEGEGGEIRDAISRQFFLGLCKASQKENFPT